MKSLFEHQEVQDLFPELLDTLLIESDRGAILLGASHVDVQLRKLFEAVLPPDMSKKRRSDLLRYPGPLSTYLARTEIAYGLRFISKHTYDALRVLKRIRNDVAHGLQSFKLRNHKDELRAMYQLGPDMSYHVNRVALEMMVKYKLEVVTNVVKERRPDWKTEFTQDYIIDRLLSNDELMDELNHQLLKWEFVVGLSLLCATIVHHREVSAAILQQVDVLGQLGRME